MNNIVSPIKTLVRQFFPGLNVVRSRLLMTWLKILIRTRVLQAVPIPDDDPTIHNRTHVIIREAQQRGYRIAILRLFGTHVSNLFVLHLPERNVYFEGLPTSPIDDHSSIDFDDKSIFKRRLEAAGLPVPRGRKFFRLKAAVGYAKSLGFPLVVKPVASSLSKHTTTNITSEAELIAAIKRARTLGPSFLVEQHIPGDVYRATLLRHRLIACCRRDPPSILGDGRHTIRELVTAKNRDPRRGPARAKNSTLHQIPLTTGLEIWLAKQHLSVSSVPQRGQRIVLHPKVVLACGADIHDTTDEIHPDNQKLLEEVSRVCPVPLVGLDVISPDLAVSYRSQPLCIMHRSPASRAMWRA